MARPFTSPRFREPAVLIKQAAGSRREGIFTPGAETRTNVALVSAPASAGTVRDIVPEGARIEDWRMFWLEADAEPLRVGDAPTEGDVIERKGLRYRLRRVRDYDPHGFIEAVGQREDAQSD